MNRKKVTALLALAVLLLVSCDKKQLEPESKEVFGTICTVNLYENGTEKLYAKIFDKLNEIERDFDSAETKEYENAKRFFQLNNEMKKYGAIKGCAIEAIKTITRKSHVRRMMVNLDGKVYVAGTKQDKSPWKIGLKNPANPSGISIAVLTGLSDISVMTKAEFNEDASKLKKYPSVTIISTDTIFADAYSSYIFDFLNNSAESDATSRRDSTPEEKIAEICEKLRKMEVKMIIIDSEGKIYASKALEGYLGSEFDDYQIVFM